MNSIVPVQDRAVEGVKVLANIVHALYEQVMTPGLDYGVIPGTGDKPTLLLPGMEKLMRALNVKPVYMPAHIIRDYDKPLFHYEYECTLVDVETGLPVPGGSAMGLATSAETKWGWRWVPRHRVPQGIDPDTLAKRGGSAFEFEFALNKAETTGKYGKPADYWQMFHNAIAAGTATREERQTKNGKSPGYAIDMTEYRIVNEAVYDQVNTICKIAQKRALASAIKGAANVSELFTVDLDDLVEYATHNGYSAPPPQSTPSAPTNPSNPPQDIVDAEFSEATDGDWYTVDRVRVQKRGGKQQGVMYILHTSIDNVNIVTFTREPLRAAGIDCEDWDNHPDETITLPSPIEVRASHNGKGWDIHEVQL
jgi:hypothetical protein